MLLPARVARETIPRARSRALPRIAMAGQRRVAVAVEAAAVAVVRHQALAALAAPTSLFFKIAADRRRSLPLATRSDRSFFPSFNASGHWPKIEIKGALIVPVKRFAHTRDRHDVQDVMRI